MDGMKEKELEKLLVRSVKSAGGIAYKFVSPGNDGVPDRIVIFPDRRPVFVELKADRGKLSALQEVQIGRLCELGQYATVVRGLDGLIDFFRCAGYPDIVKSLKTKQEECHR